MSDSEIFTSLGGAHIAVVGPPDLLTIERMEIIGRRFDDDPRIASVSVVAGATQGFTSAIAPAGAVVCLRVDHDALIGSHVDLDVEDWAAQASTRGLMHEWWITPAPDVAQADQRPMSRADQIEHGHSSSTHFQRDRSTKPRSLSIAVDASWLGEHQTGAQVLTTAAVAALANHQRVREISLRGLESLPTYAQHLHDRSKVRLGGDSPADVCWFPNQIDFRSNFAQARSWGDRVITTYLDLIAYDVPRYHASPEAWDAYRTLQRTTALASDGITTISSDVADRLQRQVPVLNPRRVRPIPLGLDHIALGSVPEEVPDNIAVLGSALQTKPFLLVLGNDFIHKNRDFAIRVWQELLQSGISCDLVLAGLHVRSSSSREAEELVLANHVDLRGQVHTLGHVSSQARAWLLSHAAAVVYPSSAEGFGFVPYEAAALGTPSTFTLFGPLAELTGVTNAPTSWSVSAYVDDVRGLLVDEAVATKRITELTRAIESRSWVDFADDLVAFMFEILQMPPAPGGVVLAEVSQDAAELNALLASKTWRMTAPLRKAGKALRGRGRR